MGSPKQPSTPAAPPPPPPPTPITEELKAPELKKRKESTRRRGVSGLTVRRRPSVNVGNRDQLSTNI